MRQELDATALRQWVVAGCAALAAAREEIDALNVYPVADCDTGTNLLLTMEAAEQAMRRVAPDLATAGPALVRGALLGAHGNSGVILSQLLRGLLEALGAAPYDGRSLATGLARAAELARAAVAAPVEGTVLTVATGAATAAAAAGPALADVVSAAVRGAERSLVGTTAQLPALRRAGVVDAGGRGLVVLLRALEAVVHEVALPVQPVQPVRARSAPCPGPEVGGGPAYEVQFLLHGAAPAAAATLTATLGGLGDSLLVVGDDEVRNVHVHVHDPDAALTAGRLAGRLTRVGVTRFADQVRARPVPAPGRHAVVAVAGGPGLHAALAAAGAVVAGPGPLSGAELLDAVCGTGCVEVLLLPDDRRGLAAAPALVPGAAERGVRLVVGPTSSPVQVLAALAVADPTTGLEVDLAAMTAATEATRTGEVVLAVHEARTTAGPCLPGDALGVVAGRVTVVGVDAGWVARRLLDHLAPGGELLTVVLGRGAGPEVGAALSAHAGAHHPQLEVTVLQGGQAGPVVVLGVE